MKKTIIAIIVIAVAGWCVYVYGFIDQRMCRQIRSLAKQQRVPHSTRDIELNEEISVLRTVLVSRGYLTRREIELEHLPASYMHNEAFLNRLNDYRVSNHDPVIGLSVGGTLYDNPRRDVLTVTIEARPHVIQQWETFLSSIDKPMEGEQQPAP